MKKKKKLGKRKIRSGDKGDKVGVKYWKSSLLIKEMCRKSFCKIYYLISIIFHKYYYISPKRFRL